MSEEQKILLGIALAALLGMVLALVASLMLPH